MHRSCPLAAAVLALGTATFAQSDASARLRPVTGPVRDAGVYHLASGTWTRHASQAEIGAAVIYDNTCPSGYFSAFSGDTYVDEGRIPSLTSPTNAASRPGCATSYVIDGFQIAYCTDQLPATFGTYSVNFFQAYANCSSVIGVAPTASFALNGLPGASSTGPRCWSVTIDLDSPPLTASLAFTMLADGDGSYAGTAISNLFGWSMSSTAPGTATGSLIAGNPMICTQFDGTRWDSPVNYLEAGTGMSTANNFRNEGPTTLPGCWWFGGFPYASFHLELYSDACVGDWTPLYFCEGSGTGTLTPCPCGNNSALGAGLGCLNSFGVGAGLRATGSASLSADTVVLSAINLPASSVLFFQGTVRQNAGNGTVFGDGLRCAGGTITRLQTHSATGTPGAATSSYPQAGEPSVTVRGGISSPGIRTYQAWYRNTAAFCTPGGFNLTNGLEIAWAP